MEITECYWEKRNLNCSAVEVVVQLNEHFCAEDFKSLEKYDYVVVKVPVNKVDYNFGLSELGYVMFEMQVDMYANMDKFNFEEKNIKRMFPYIDFKEIKTEDELNLLINKITPGMFLTDRISLDPAFGIEKGCKRYINWVRDEFCRSSKTVNVIYKDNIVGFGMFLESLDIIRGLVGGLFTEYQNDGIGLITPLIAPLYAKMNNLPTKKIINPISSNNKAVWDLYEHFGFKPHNPHYVFIKHNL